MSEQGAQPYEATYVAPSHKYEATWMELAGGKVTGLKINGTPVPNFPVVYLNPGDGLVLRAQISEAPWSMSIDWVEMSKWRWRWVWLKQKLLFWRGLR